MPNDRLPSFVTSCFAVYAAVALTTTPALLFIVLTAPITRQDGWECTQPVTGPFGQEMCDQWTRTERA